MIRTVSLLIGASIILLSAFSQIQAQEKDPLHLYVWDFGTREGDKIDLTDNFTKEFEEAFIQAKCSSLIERRNYDKLLSQKNNEKAIMSIEGITQNSLEDLKILDADGVIFGEVYDDVKSGEIKVTAIVQAFDGRNIALESIRFSRGKQFDAASREANMQKLAEALCTSLANKDMTSISDSQPFDFVGTYHSKNEPQKKITISKINEDQYLVSTSEWYNISLFEGSNEGGKNLKGALKYTDGQYRGYTGYHYMEYIGNNVVRVKMQWGIGSSSGEWFMIKEK